MRSRADLVRFAVSVGITAVVHKRVLNCLWELTHRCNARCGICSYWTHPSDPRQELRLPEIHLGLKKIHAYGCRFVNFTGGEPILRLDLEQIVTAACELGMCTSVVTNGSLLTPARITALKDAGLDCLLVSLDSVQPEVHDAHRGIRGLHAHVLRCLEWIARDFVGAHRIGGLMFVLSSGNLAEIDDVLRLAERLGVYVLMQPYHPNKTGEHSGTPPITTETVRHLLRDKKAGGPLLSSPKYLQGLPRFCAGFPPSTCSAGQKYFSVDPYGFLHPCVDRQAAGHILRDDIAIIRSAAALESVRHCAGCWYCFRGEADSTLSLTGYLEKVRAALAVVRRNGRRNRTHEAKLSPLTVSRTDEQQGKQPERMPSPAR